MNYFECFILPVSKNIYLNTVIENLQPWEPQCFYPDFPYEIICGDSWSDTRLVLATESGVYVVEGKSFTHQNISPSLQSHLTITEGGSCRMIFDKTVQIKQLTVVEAHGILLVRSDRGTRYILDNAALTNYHNIVL